MRLAARVVLAGFAAVCIAAQLSAQPRTRPAKTCVPPDLSAVQSINTVKKDMPYSARRVSACEETLPDGTVVKGTRTFLEWRDSQGRTRRESRDPLFEGQHLYEVDVTDPVEHVFWTWQVGKDSPHQAIKTKYEMRNEYTQFPLKYQFGNYVHSQGPGFKDERLGPKWLNGVYATGDRFTQVCKPGQNGNKTNHPVTTTDETWLSVDLGLIVQSLQTTADGSSLVENLFDIDRSEPAPSLFRPPAGFQILESPKTLQDPGLHLVKIKPKNPAKGTVMMLSPHGTPLAKH